MYHIRAPWNKRNQRKSSPTRRNKMEAVGDCHWRIDWIESQEDEIAPVIRPNLKILFFSLRFDMSNSEKKMLFSYFKDHEKGYNIKDASYIYVRIHLNIKIDILPLDSQTVSKIISDILFGRTLSLICFIFNRLEIVHQLTGPCSNAVMRQPGWSVSSTVGHILVRLRRFVISYCKYQKKTNRLNQYFHFFSLSLSLSFVLTEFVLTYKKYES